MFNNWEKFIEAYQNSSPSTQNFIDSNILSLYLQKKLSGVVDVSIMRDLILYSNNKVLGLSNQTDLENYLLDKNLNSKKIIESIKIALDLQITNEDYSALAPKISPDTRKMYSEHNEDKYSFICSANSRITLLDFIEKYPNISNVVNKKYLITICDLVLGFYKIEDTVPLLQQELDLDARTAALLGADVLDFLAPLSDPNWLPPTEEDDVPVNTTFEPSPVTEETLPTPSPGVQTASAATELPELRTMATDMIEGRSPVRNTFNATAAIDEPVYVSSQPTIEKPAPEAPSYTAPLYQPPKPNVDAPLEKPRWG